MSRPTVVLVGTLDTKGQEYAFLRERLEDAGVDTLVVDVGTGGTPRVPGDVTREDVAASGGFELGSLADRG
ncbi:MAG TPA: Tm-1-like ATP-binding domain-containing protein, partial [Nonomuraea sp.]|nr:Tm-1-like ATP-binding domain-containing protein [Nonomuraea sp.]